MGRVALCRGVTFGPPRFFYESSKPTLEPEIDRQSNSLAVYVNGFVPTAFFEGPNFQGAALVVTNPGSIQNLSQTPWGNWANRIRSVKIGPSFDTLLADLRAGKESERQIIVVDQLPDSVEDDLKVSGVEISFRGNPPEFVKEILRRYVGNGDIEVKVESGQLDESERSILSAYASGLANSDCKIIAAYGCGSCCNDPGNFRANLINTTCGWQCWNCSGPNTCG